MVGDSPTIMEITQRLGQGQTTYGFDIRSLCRAAGTETLLSVSL